MMIRAWTRPAGPALWKGKPYASGKNGGECPIIAKAAKLHMDGRLEGIIRSRKMEAHAGAYIYKYTVPVLYLAPEQEGMTILHMSDLHFSCGDRKGWPKAGVPAHSEKRNR